MGFDESPLLVIWETTQACDLSCVHCRPTASPRRHSSELSTEEAHRLLETVREFGDPLMVFNGGDPLKRPDLLALLGRSVELGLRTSVSPSSSPLLTKEIVREFQRRGVARMTIGLDGADAESHDAFRGEPGSFGVSIGALEEAQRIGLETQIQTTVHLRNLHFLDRIAGLAARVGIRGWSLFFPIMTGRAGAEEDLSAKECEQVFEKIYNISRVAPFDVTTAEANHYRRYLARRLGERAEPADPKRAVWRAASGSDGRGSIFVSHTGEIYPSGFLPISAGNVRVDSLLRVYRTSPLFLELRDGDWLHGKCRFCEYRRLCGGSRGCAYALTGDYLAPDPRCGYQPCAGAAQAVQGAIA